MDGKNPTIVIINGANWIGVHLVDILTEHKGNVIVVDDFNDKNSAFIKRFSENKRFIFIERDKLDTLRKNFTKIKYFIHLKNDFNATDDEISSKQFIGETKFVDEVLTIALEKNSTYVLTSSIHLHKDFVLKKNYTRESKGSAYTESDLQDYIERTVLEYVKKAGLNGRIARLGNVYGPEMDLSKDELLLQILTDAFYRDEIRVYGDGLEFMYYIFISDAIQGILRALFTPETKGEVYSLTNPDEISVLSIVNKVLSFQPRAKRIKFLKHKGSYNPLYEKAYIPDPNLAEIGWKPTVSFERGIAQVFDYFKKDVSLQSYAQKENISEYNTFPDNSDIQIEFDDTLNLSEKFYSYGNDVEPQQFTEFYKKLNREDSPIYNHATRKQKATYDYEPQLKKPFPVFDYLKSGILVFLIVVLVGFLTVPTVGFTIFFNNLSSESTQLQTAIAKKDYSTNLDSSQLSKEFDDNVYTIKWLIAILGQQSTESDIKNVALGIDRATEAYRIIKSEKLEKYLSTNEKVSEEDVTKIRTLLIVLTSAEKNLEKADKMTLPFNANKNVRAIQIWVVDTEEQFSSKIASS